MESAYRQADLTAVIARRIADEKLACARLYEFADRLFEAAAALARELEAGGVPIELHRGRGEGALRLELSASGVPERIVLLTQRAVAHLPEHPGAHGALYVFVLSDGSGVAVPVERFLVSASGAVRCDGICAPGAANDPRAVMRRLIDAIWAQGRQFWTPFVAVGPLPAAELEVPHLHGQLGFRPGATRANRVAS